MNQATYRPWWRWLAPLSVAAAWLMALAAYPFAPARIPIHWNVSGEIDGYAGRVVGIFMFPVLITAIAALLRAAPRLDPKRQSYASFSEVYGLMQVGVIVFLVIMQAIMLAVALGQPVNMGAVIVVLVGGLFVFLGNLLGKTRPNWMVGIRTPWTLSSPDVWTRTHRVGGRLMVGIGLAYMAAGLVLPLPAVAAVIVAGAVGLVAVSMGYSYWAWRQLGLVTPSEDQHG